MKNVEAEIHHSGLSFDFNPKNSLFFPFRKGKIVNLYNKIGNLLSWDWNDLNFFSKFYKVEGENSEQEK